ncbi:DUF2484 family protein [Histidinibacterium aquaticum]|uniref:DUF2484 family protein n=1 Tax=Histidinibacterium aquaticum TaxID=2613962 RepID=A0A5J5GI55_9RHOB|nr:DUF2484 family protein [Histidinibacterium aquaticum]KAA9007929.1 DUF2484 family protein [Histidinibacterium aquaticum]
MSAALLTGALWVIAATVTALLPMRRQYAPGLALLVTAPGLILWLSILHGWWIGAFALFAFLSMFRRPLLYIARRAIGLPVETPR